MSEAVGALSHLRVLELGQLIAGPFCGQLLGDMGADVIKIEAPGVGDPMRSWGQGKPVWWSVIGRNKRSVTLDLRKPEGREVLRRLAAEADILIENFRPGTLEKWELAPEALQALNPRLIVVRVSGFGQTGPYAKRAGYGSIGEAMGGMRYLAGEPDRPPSRVGLSIGDALAATFACLGALTALESRHRSGRGQVVDSAIYEAVLAMMESTVPEYTEAGVIRERTGAILPKIAPSNVYPTADGEMVLIGANQDSVFARLAEAMGEPELASDPRYAHCGVDPRLLCRCAPGPLRGPWRTRGAHLSGAGHAEGPAVSGTAIHCPRGRRNLCWLADAKRFSAAVANPGENPLAGAGPGRAHGRGPGGPRL